MTATKEELETFINMIRKGQGLGLRRYFEMMLEEIKEREKSEDN